MDYAKEIADALLDIKAVGFSLEKPITFKSGIKSPVYVDNRTFPFHPELWSLVIKGFAELIEVHQLNFEVLAGIETAGIPHSAALGFFLQKPSVFVRKTVKDHGTKKMVEGGQVKDRTVLLIEDHVSTGLSSLAGVTALRNEGAEVNTCLAITSFEFAESQQAFEQANVELFTLTTFSQILKQAESRSLLEPEQIQSVKDWLADPHGWASKYAVV